MTVSADEQFWKIAIEVAGKYLEMSGGSPADASALGSAVSETLGQVVDGAPDGATIDLAFEPNGHGVKVTVTCGANTAVVRHPLPVRKG